MDALTCQDIGTTSQNFLSLLALSGEICYNEINTNKHTMEVFHEAIYE